MKKLLAFAALFAVVALTSCKYDDDDLWNSVHGLENRVAKLEELCNKTNTNLSALQAIVTALQNNDYITSVDPLTENGKVVGYTIKFAKSNPIVIYNGKDGADGNTPIIGVKQDEDGIYYWTLDDKFIVVDGQKIKAQGTDGVSPKLEIREGYWWISYDNGANWTQLGQATGEDGKDGDSIKITQDEDNVYFELADGTIITLPKNCSNESIIQFKDENFFNALLAERVDTDGDGQISTREAASCITLDISENNITSIDEIHYFTTLVELDCSDNQLTSLDISKNTALTRLNCGGNQLTSLDVSKNTALIRLSCSNNQLVSLDIDTNIELKLLNCGLNQLTALDISKNTALTTLNLSGNRLTLLNVNLNAALVKLTCGDNQLISLNVSKNTALTELSCYGNRLIDLDVSKNTALTWLDIDNNQLTSLDVSKNRELKSLLCNNNPLHSLIIYKYHKINAAHTDEIMKEYSDIITYIE